MILAFRGSGKTSVATIVYSIYRLLVNPDIRILLASKSGGNASAMLSEIKSHLTSNDDFVETFGDQQGELWAEAEINVAARKKFTKEANLTTLGIESAVVSKHYDLILVDDLVDEPNSRTPIMRQKTWTFFYKTLTPCLEPDGQMVVLGTRYHYKDLHGVLLEAEARGATLIVPALSGNATDGWFSAWPEKFPVEYLLSLRNSKRMGQILFDSQYQLDCRKMHGDIFDYDDCTVIPDVEIPANLPRYGAADLAVSMDSKRDLFAIVIIAYDVVRDYVYILDFFTDRLAPSKQRQTMNEYIRHYNCVKFGIESNAYQAAALVDLKESHPDLPLVKLFTAEDKITRAVKLAGRFETHHIAIREGLADLVEQLVLFPGGDHDDGFDALDFAIKTVKAKERKPREEPGLI